MKYIRIIIVIIFALAFQLCYSQSNKKIDSLKMELQRAKEDTNRVKKLIEIGGIIAIDQNNPKESLGYFTQALKISEKLNYLFGLSRSCINISASYNKIGKIDSTLWYALQSLTFFKQLKNIRGEAKALYGVGKAYFKMGKFDSGYYYNLKALEIADKLKDKDLISLACSNMVDAFLSRGNYDKAMEYELKNLKICEEQKDTLNMAESYLSITSIYHQKGDINVAKKYINEALKIIKNNNSKRVNIKILTQLASIEEGENEYENAIKHNKEALKLTEELSDQYSMVVNLNNIGMLYSLIDDYSNSILYLLKAINIAEVNQYKPYLTVVFLNISNTYKYKGDFDKSITYLKKSLDLAVSLGDIQNQYKLYGNLSILNEKMHNYKDALENHKQFLILKDSILNEKTNSKIAQLQIEYETEKKDREIENLQKEQKIKDLEIEKNKQELLAQKLEQEKKQQAIDLLTASKKIQELTLTQKQKEIADLVKDQQIKNLLLTQSEQEQEKKQQSIELLLSSQKIKEGEIKLLEKTRQNQALSLSQKQTEIKNRTILYIGSLIFLLIGVASFIFYYRYNQASQKIATERKMVQLEQKALQLQMNPHFIFNSLNSINNYIMNNESELASDYLARFSKLMRMILEASRETFISVSRELEILRYYLTLEKVRFKNQFDFDIQVDQKIDADHVAIPPMLIQPYIENAILHGILPSNRKCNILICLYLETDKKMICLVKDNGIGINKSIAIKKEKAIKSHKSVGMNITQERLAVLGEMISDKLQVEVKDIGEEANTGTEVRLEMPVKNLEV